MTPSTRTIVRLRRLLSRLGFEHDWYLVLLAMGIGLVMGVTAIAYIWPLRLVEEWAAGADPGLLHWLVPFVPAVGALGAGAVNRLIAVEMHGPGVSTVMYAVHRARAVLPAKLLPRKWLASTLTIGSGGSAGAEGPIVTIGAALGSVMAQRIRTSPQSRATLLGCGAAAGISAVFNAPIAGIFFVMEILLRDFSLRTFTPIVIASVVAAACAQGVLGGDPLFEVGDTLFREGTQFTLLQIPNMLLLGLICGIGAATFIRGLDLAGRTFRRLPVPTIVRPACGAVLLGALGWVTFMTIGHDVGPEGGMPPFYGNGYPVTQWMLAPATYGDIGGLSRAAATIMLLMTAIALLKGVATCLTIGSGGAGGLFAPSLMMGAATGGAVGAVVNALGWFPAANPALYALVGMGAMLAATSHAPLTGILIVYETTRSYETILPLMLAAVISVVVARLITRESVYTGPLRRFGVRLGVMSDLTILRRLSVQDVPLAEAVVVRHDDSAQRLLDLTEHHHVADFVVVNDHLAYCGMVTAADVREALVFREAIPLLQVSELQRSDLPVIAPDDTLDVVLDRFARHDVQALAVLETRHDDGAAGDVRGLITRERLMRAYQGALERE